MRRFLTAMTAVILAAGCSDRVDHSIRPADLPAAPAVKAQFVPDAEPAPGTATEPPTPAAAAVEPVPPLPSPSPAPAPLRGDEWPKTPPTPAPSLPVPPVGPEIEPLVPAVEPPDLSNVAGLFQKYLPPPVSAPPPPAIPQIELDEAFVQSQAMVSAGETVRLLVFHFHGCVYCNLKDVQAGAEADGLSEFIEPFDITEKSAKRYGLPTNEFGQELVPYYMLVGREADGREWIIKRFPASRQPWSALKAELLKHAHIHDDRQDKLVGAIKAGSIKAGAEPVQKALAFAQRWLGNDGSISIGYKRPGVTGYIRVDDFGTPLQIPTAIALSWRYEGDALTLTLNPPIKARLMPLWWALLDKLTLTKDRLDAAVRRAPDVYLKIE